ETNERIKKKRYKALFALPAFTVLMLLLSENFSYIFISFVVLAFILIQLIIFGLMDTKYHYSIGSFLKDSAYLILSSVLITYLLAPWLISLFTSNMNLTDFVLNGLNFFVSMLLLYGAWFSIVSMQSRSGKRLERWKWEVIGLSMRDKKKAR
ncbi:MAG: hypothetical protein ABS873_02215, partial [Alkalibacterium sp.]